jgi:GrpB-like predicted nucleotidyltransferase (UPF0157 family)
MPQPDETNDTTAQAATAGDESYEEHLRAIHTVPLVPLNGQIELAEYDPEWPRLYAREAERIRSALGARARLLEHAGSTSVPGLAAKPRIDIILAVPDSADEAAYLPDLLAAGYVLWIREPDWFEHRVCKGPDTDVNLHIFTDGCTEITRMLRFRDWLRTHEDDRQLYERTKRELARRTWQYTQHYADAKSDVVREILARAEGPLPQPLP